MYDINKFSKAVFQCLRGHNLEVAMFDEEGSQIYEPSSAIRFFTNEKNITLSIDDNNENSTLRTIVGNSTDIKSIMPLIKSLRNLSSVYGLQFNIRKYAGKISPKDFVNGNLLEAMHGSTKSSFLKLPNAKMIVRHKSVVDENKFGSRSRNISKVIIENKDGERLLMPSVVLAPARAMLRHVSEGFHWSDDVGQAIYEMSKDHGYLNDGIKYLRKNKRKINEDVTHLIEQLRKKKTEISKLFNSIYGNYEKHIGNLQEKKSLFEDEEIQNRVEQLNNILELEEDSMGEETRRTMAKYTGDLYEGRPKKVEMMPLPQLGVNVSVNGWDMFKNGQIELIRTPEYPRLGHEANEEIIKLQAISQVCSDDSIANLLSRVATDMDDGSDSLLHKRIAQVAILAAETDASTNPNENGYILVEEEKDESFVSSCNEDIIVNESVRDFGKWLDGFGIDSVMENLSSTLTGLDQEVPDFDIDEFIDIHGEDFGYGVKEEIEVDDIISSATEFLDAEDNFSALTNNQTSREIASLVVDILDEEGITVLGRDTLEDEMQNEDDFLTDVGFDPDAIILDEDNLMDDLLISNNNEEDDKEDDKEDDNETHDELLLSSVLDHEDVVISNNPDTNLKQDVGSDSSTDDINRILSLAGQARNELPRRPTQP